MGEWTIGAVLDAIAEADPDRLMTVCGTRRSTFGESAERTRRLANYLAGQGLGAHRERADLANWECPSAPASRRLARRAPPASATRQSPRRAAPPRRRAPAARPAAARPGCSCRPRAPARTRPPRRRRRRCPPSTRLRSTPVRIVRGCDPTASRMPNSRVRPLTENASTPATPTTEIASATAAKPPNTIAFSRSGASTSARTSSSVAARSTG